MNWTDAAIVVLLIDLVGRVAHAVYAAWRRVTAQMDDAKCAARTDHGYRPERETTEPAEVFYIFDGDGKRH